MKKLGEIITEDLFINAFEICQKYVVDEEVILDVNLRFLKPYLVKLKKSKVRSFYRSFINTDLIFSLPELFSTDTVFVPKNITSVREYRYFSAYSLILYNAIGLLFVDCCSQMIEDLDFHRKGIYSYYPTKFYKSSETENNWDVRSTYKNEYSNYSNKLREVLKQNDVVLKIDISSYFESVVHKKLISLLNTYTKESKLRSFKLDKESFTALEFYFESLMLRQSSIPQGRKNFVSDYLGYLYLIPFDLNITEILKNYKLKFKAVIRYVDDINIISENPTDMKRELIFKELLTIEQSISNWLFRNLFLKIGPHKSERFIFKNKSNIEKYLKIILKTISSAHKYDLLIEPEKTSEIEDSLKKFTKVIEKYNYGNEDKFEFNFKKDDVENLKEIFKKNFQHYILKKENKDKLSKLLSAVKYELTTDHINILLLLFFHKNLKGVYRNIYLKYLNDNLNLTDKRFIHLLLMTLSQDDVGKQFRRHITRNKIQLYNDDYGKYLLLYFFNCLEITSINKGKSGFYLESNHNLFNRIVYEYFDVKDRKFFYSNVKSDYLSIIKIISEDESLLVDSIIQQLKDFVYYYLRNKYYIAFNSFHNLFHEICKIKLKIKDNEVKVKELIKKLTLKYPRLGLQDELLIMKFFDRRNFNAISHPSHKNIPTEMVSKDELNEYLHKILELLNIILK